MIQLQERLSSRDNAIECRRYASHRLRLKRRHRYLINADNQSNRMIRVTRATSTPFVLSGKQNTIDTDPYCEANRENKVGQDTDAVDVLLYGTILF